MIRQVNTVMQVQIHRHDPTLAIDNHTEYIQYKYHSEHDTNDALDHQMPSAENVIDSAFQEAENRSIAIGPKQRKLEISGLLDILKRLLMRF